MNDMIEGSGRYTFGSIGGFMHAPKATFQLFKFDAFDTRLVRGFKSLAKFDSFSQASHDSKP